MFLHYLRYFFLFIIVIIINLAFYFPFKIIFATGDAGEIHLSRSDKLQSSGDRVEQIATIDVPLQNGGTKSQEENHEAGKLLFIGVTFFYWK